LSAQHQQNVTLAAVPQLLAADRAAARKFYHSKPGLPIVREDQNAIVFRCGSGTHLDVTKRTVGAAGHQTQAARQVSGIRGEVAQLRARGINAEDYDTQGLKTEEGIADIGFAQTCLFCMASALDRWCPPRVQRSSRRRGRQGGCWR